MPTTAQSSFSSCPASPAVRGTGRSMFLKITDFENICIEVLPSIFDAALKTHTAIVRSQPDIILQSDVPLFALHAPQTGTELPSSN